jgi:hypothetical protein
MLANIANIIDTVRTRLEARKCNPEKKKKDRRTASTVLKNQTFFTSQNFNSTGTIRPRMVVSTQTTGSA